MHRDEEVVGVVKEWGKTMIKIELPSLLVEGIDFQGPDADFIGDVQGTPEGIHQEEATQFPALEITMDG